MIPVWCSSIAGASTATRHAASSASGLTGGADGTASAPITIAPSGSLA